MSQLVIIIPVRLGSSRLARKALLECGGKPLVMHTVERARQALRVHGEGMVLVATDSTEVVNAVAGQIGIFFETGRDHWCGSARVAHAASRFPEAVKDSVAVINWQVDEPLVEPSDVLRLVRHLAQSKLYHIGTLVAPRDDEDSEHIVKVNVVANGSWCADFSRTAQYQHQHVGIYAFRPHVLPFIASCEQSERSYTEHLEQLSWMKHHTIGAVRVERAPLAINCESDFLRFQELAGGAADV